MTQAEKKASNDLFRPVSLGNEKRLPAFFVRNAVWLFYVAFALRFIGSFFEVTTFTCLLFVPKGLAIDVLDAIAVLLLLAKFLLQKTSIVGWCCAAVIVLAGFLSWRCGHESFFFWLTLFFVCSEGVSLKTLARISITLTSFLVIITLLCSSVGAIENRIFERASGSRPAYGFAHPNYLGLYLLALAIDLVVLRIEEKPGVTVMAILAFFLLDVLFVGSRSSGAAMALLGLLFICFSRVSKSRTRRRLTMAFAVFVLLSIVGSVAVMVRYDSSLPVVNDLFRSINVALSGRLSLAHKYFEMQPLTAFGDDFSRFPPIYWELGQPATFLVDNAYCHVLLRFGVVPFALMVTGFVLLFVDLIRKNTWNSLLLGIVVMAFVGLSEARGMHVEYNYFLIGMASELLFSGLTASRTK